MQLGQDWFREGNVVDVFEAAPDAEFILEAEEIEREWRFCRIPSSSFLDVAGLDLSRFLEDSCPNEPRESEVARCLDIEKWMADSGGAEKALRECPVIVVIDKAGLDVLDGCHRIAVAMHRHKLSYIPAVVSRYTHAS